MAEVVVEENDHFYGGNEVRVRSIICSNRVIQFGMSFRFHIQLKSFNEDDKTHFDHWTNADVY